MSVILIAIDGRCGAGKTTLAAKLARELDGQIVHADHFFLQPFQRTEERLSEVGGNIDYERLVREVLEPLFFYGACEYRPFDCGLQRLSDEVVKIGGSRYIIIEGSYSCHPLMQDYYDYKIFADVDAETQIARIEAREGCEKLKIFKEKWIPLEEKYFAAFDVAANCDIIIG